MLDAENFDGEVGIKSHYYRQPRVVTELRLILSSISRINIAAL